MALPWLAAYGSGTRAVYTTLVRAAREGISADSVYRFLRDSGHDVVRSEIREVVGRLRLDNAVRDYIQRLTPSQRPLKQFIPFTSSTITKTYRYTMEVTGFNLRTEERSTRTLSMTSDRLLSRQEAAEIMTNAISTRDGEPYVEVESADVTFIERSA